MTMREVGEETWQRARGAGASLHERGQRAFSRTRAWMDGDGEQLAHGLGWFSLGLGLAELAAPEGLARFMGVRADDDNCALLRACGLRELANGVGILTTEEPQSLLWGRVAGDVMDLLLLGAAAASRNTRRERLALAGAAVLGVTALDVLAAQQCTSHPPAGARALGDGGASRLMGRGRAAGRGRSTAPHLRPNVHVKRAITVWQSPLEVYRFWHQLDNLPSFMSHLESIEVLDARRSHWKTKAPLGMSVEWDAEITIDEAGQRIAWRSLPGGDVEHAGEVRFVPTSDGHGTEVHVELRYRPPAGRVGAVFAKLFGEAPEQQIAADLRRFKQVLETGEVVRSDARIRRTPHPARPAPQRALPHAPVPQPWQEGETR